ncbi:MAG: 50S ribosomal protein L24 [Solirubrobacteraceae bacterium]|nr:50S ribosomal protein L24 [Solirubrobacteraceae bacterium]
MALRIRTDDEVLVITGKDKGKTGKVLRVEADRDRVYVSGINIRTKHVKPVPGSNEPGGIVKEEAPVHVSNVSLVDPKDGKPTRVRSEVRDGKKVRIAVRSGEVI